VTILAWRLVQKRRAKSAFDGEGAARAPGRWNREGTPMVYAAGSLALAALEILANLPDEQLSRQPFAAIPVAFDEKLVLRIDTAALPENWSTYPAPLATKELGTQWVKDAASAVLAVPSAIIPIEPNYLINPRHPDFSKISIGKPETFAFDKRLLG
jgi:RES domain-containing protein